MSAVPLSRPLTVDRLAVGVSRISVRHGHYKPRYRQPKPEMTGYPEGHGEKIWIFSNVRSKQVVYSHDRVLDVRIPLKRLTGVIRRRGKGSFTGITGTLEREMTFTNTSSCRLQVYKALKQIPFSAKKARPAKIRKDLWKHLAMVEFPAGKGVVGQSVFAKLREFNRRHLLEWDDNLLFDDMDTSQNRKVLTRQERGKKILEQKENAIADLAAVLAGSGKSNWVRREVKEAGAEGEGEAEAGVAPRLCEATVYWANGMDRHHASLWTENVKHGLLPNGVDWSAEPGSVEPSSEFTLLSETPAKAEKA